MRPPRRVVVTEHALVQFQERRRDFRPYSVIDEFIRNEVVAAFAAGRVKDHRPKDFMLYGRNHNHLPPGQRLALTEDGSMAWIVKRESHDDVVLTTLTRTGVNRR